MSNNRFKIVTFVLFSCFALFEMRIPTEASYILTGNPNIESILQIGFSMVMGIVILAVILLIYSRITLSNINKRKKKSNEEDYFER